MHRDRRERQHGDGSLLAADERCLAGIGLADDFAVQLRVPPHVFLDAEMFEHPLLGRRTQTGRECRVVEDLVGRAARGRRGRRSGPG